MSEPFTLTLLAEADAEDLLAFERENRAFFAQWVPDRGDDYFANFDVRHAALVEENRVGTSLLYLIRDADGRIVGRVNIGDIRQPEITELGYRIAQNASGHGLATRAVGEALARASALGLQRIHARTTADNIASQRVLERTGFIRTPRAQQQEGQREDMIYYIFSP